MDPAIVNHINSLHTDYSRLFGPQMCSEEAASRWPCLAWVHGGGRTYLLTTSVLFSIRDLGTTEMIF